MHFDPVPSATTFILVPAGEQKESGSQIITFRFICFKREAMQEFQTGSLITPSIQACELEMIMAHVNKHSLVNPQYDPPLLTDAGGLF